MYNKNGKSASNSKKIRATGDTYKLALKMLEEKKNDLLQQVAVVRAAVASGKPIPASKPKPQPVKKVERKESFTDLRDDAFTSDNIPMSISEKIKSEGRARKVPSDAPSASASSNHGSPAPTMAPKMSSPAPPKVDKPPKKRGIAAPVKKQTAKKPKVEGTLSLLNICLPYPKIKPRLQTRLVLPPPPIAQAKPLVPRLASLPTLRVMMVANTASAVARMIIA